MKKSILSIVLIGTFSIPIFASQFITIGTGGISGTYYPTGQAICSMVNKLKKQTEIRCSVEATSGSYENVNTIKSGEFDFGISQSDTAYRAYHGKGKFSGKPNKALRSVFAIYPELLAFVTRKDSNINTILDMKGKNINIDLPGSGTRMTTEIVMNAFRIQSTDLILQTEVDSNEAANLLKNKKIDGYFGVFGHPTKNIQEVTNSLDIKIVPITGLPIEVLLIKYPYYARGSISGTFYKGVTKDVPSIGVKAVLVTSKSLDDNTIYTVTKSILDNFDEFKKLHPAYKTITKKSLLEGLSIPQHKGAKRAFKEAGLL